MNRLTVLLCTVFSLMIFTLSCMEYPLARASAEDSLEEVIKQLEVMGVCSGNQSFCQSLLGAAENNCEDCCEWFLKQGADIQERNEHGHTSLHVVARKKCLPLARLILAYYPEVINCKTTEGENTPLHWIAYFCLSGGLKIAEFFLEKKGDINLQNIWGQTPLYVAIMYKNVPLARFFLEKKADPTILNKKGNNCLHRTIQKNNFEIIKYLLGELSQFELINSSCDLLNL